MTLKKHVMLLFSYTFSYSKTMVAKLAYKVKFDKISKFKLVISLLFKEQIIKIKLLP